MDRDAPRATNHNFGYFAVLVSQMGLFVSISFRYIGAMRLERAANEF
jgi:hypothetical protein